MLNLIHLFFVLCLAQFSWSGRFDVIDLVERQAGTSGPIVAAKYPSTDGFPGLAPCVYASQNAWDGCGFNVAGKDQFNTSACHIPKAAVGGLAPPYNNCVAIAWVNFTLLTSTDGKAVGPSIPLNSSYNYALSFGTNAPIEQITMLNGRDFTNHYDTVTTQYPRNNSGIFSFQLRNNGNMHFEIQWPWGLPAGSFVLWQQPKDLRSVSRYASLKSRSFEYLLSRF